MVADGEADLQEQLVEWKDVLSRHEVIINLETIEVMWVGQRRKELEIYKERTKPRQINSF